MKKLAARAKAERVDFPHMPIFTYACGHHDVYVPGYETKKCSGCKEKKSRRWRHKRG